MPQKPIFTRYPLLSVPYGFVSNGQVRTNDSYVSALYRNALEFVQEPDTWEGLFKLSCLLFSNPVQEPAASLIRESLYDTEDGSFAGSLSEQVSIARAAIALYEYKPDRMILRRIASWCRFLEIEWDRLISGNGIIYRPADLMELLIRFYQLSGVRSVLRICAKLRSSAFDWTTALQTFQQSIPSAAEADRTLSDLIRKNKDELDFDEKQRLINHAGYLADGIRYSFLSGLFSGNGHELTAGKTAWRYLLKHHHAVCGGTTSDPFLAGSGSDKPVSNKVLAEWIEALAIQLLLNESEWALDELIRIIFNGLADCLHRESVPEQQYINTVCFKQESTHPDSELYARLTRSVASVYHHSVSVSENGVRINYLLPGKTAVMIGKKPLIISSDTQGATLQCSGSFDAPIEIFYARTETANLFIKNEKDTTEITPEFFHSSGRFIPAGTHWCGGERLFFVQQGRILSEPGHHQGVTFIVRNCLLSYQTDEGQYAYSVCETPEVMDGRIRVAAKPVVHWPAHGGIPADIPVIPECRDETVLLPLVPYSDTFSRITLFPRNLKNV